MVDFCKEYLVEGEVWPDRKFRFNVELICTKLHVIRKNVEKKAVRNRFNNLKESWERKININVAKCKSIANIWIWILIPTKARLGQENRSVKIIKKEDVIGNVGKLTRFKGDQTKNLREFMAKEWYGLTSL